MDVLSFVSADGNVAVTAATAADMPLMWSRFRSRIKEKSTEYCNYSTSLPGCLSLLLPGKPVLQKVGEDNESIWNNLPPVFYETATYNITIHLKKIEGKPLVVHKLKRISELFTSINIKDGEWILTAPLSFLNEPGIFDLAIKYTPENGVERVDKLRFRVVSPKLDTKDDYNRLLADINEHYNEIVFQYLTLTLQNLQRGGKSNNDVVWLSIFRNIAKDYVKWVSYIVNRPHLRQATNIYHHRADKIKLWAPQMEEEYYEVYEEGRMENHYFRHREIINTHNTRENRFVKFTLSRISSRLKNIVTTIKQRNEQAKDEDKVDEREISELGSYVTSLQQLSYSPLLRKLRGEPLQSSSMVLQKRTGYAQIYKYWLLLQKGIEFFEGSNAIGVRPIWELYELWCFLSIRKMVANILGLSFDNDITEYPMPMIKPFEDNKQEHTVLYNCHDGSKVKLIYQHVYRRNSEKVHTATTKNIPDIVISIIKPDGFELTYLFDAKYRLLDDTNLNKEDCDDNTNGADTPPYDALNQMHRYRDAIYYGNGEHSHSAKEIIGGYILFPGRGDNEAVRNRFFFKSIESINIGAFPLLPSSSDPHNEKTLLYEFLTKILTAPNSYDHIVDAKPQKGLQYSLEDTIVNNDLVLVGYYNNSNWNLIKTNKIYYVPAALGKGSINLVSGFEKTKYLLLHSNDHRMLIRLKGEGPKFYPRTALEQMGFEPTGDYYLGFEIKNLDPIESIDVSKYQLERKGKLRYTPYFTTIDRILSTM